MDQTTRFPESVAFRKSYAGLHDGLHGSATLIAHLYSRGVLGQDERIELEEMSSKPAEQRRRLISAVEGHVKQDPKVFHIFLELIENEGAMQYLSTLLKTSLGEYCKNKTKKTPEFTLTLIKANFV